MIHRIRSLLLALGLSSVLISLFLIIGGYNPWRFFWLMATSTWGSESGFLLLLTKTSLLILTGLAVAIPYRAGLFNIGGEGQMLIGGMAAVLAGIYLSPLLGILGWVVCLALGMASGAAWGFGAAVLKTKRGIHEVITTIMMNFIALHIVNECALNYFSAGQGASRTNFIAAGAQLPILFNISRGELTIGIVLSVLLAIALHWVLYRTWPGFHLLAVGKNAVASAYAGIRVGKMHGLSMLAGGACAGLAGAIQVCGIDHTFYARFTGGYGFDGIAVAFLALNEPLATIPASLILATLRASDRALQLEIGIPKEIVFIIEGIVIISIAIFTRRRIHD